VRSGVWGAAADSFPVGGGGLTGRALERAREIQLVSEPGAVADLTNAQAGEAQQPRRLEHAAVGDQLLGRPTGHVRECLGQSRLRDPQRLRVVAGRLMPCEVALQDLHESPVQPEFRVIGVAPLRLRRLEPALHPQQEHREQVALHIDAARVCGLARLPREGSDD
jgi:hypothetical protein